MKKKKMKIHTVSAVVQVAGLRLGLLLGASDCFIGLESVVEMVGGMHTARHKNI